MSIHFRHILKKNYFSYQNIAKKFKILLDVSDNVGHTITISSFGTVAEQLVDLKIEDALAMANVNPEHLDAKISEIIGKSYRFKVACQTKLIGENTYVNYNLRFDSLFISLKSMVHLF